MRVAMNFSAINMKSLKESLLIFLLLISFHQSNGQSPGKKHAEQFRQLEKIDSLYRLFLPEHPWIAVYHKKKKIVNTSIWGDINLRDTTLFRELCNIDGRNYSLYYPLICAMAESKYNVLEIKEMTQCFDSTTVSVTKERVFRRIKRAKIQTYFIVDPKNGQWKIEGCKNWLGGDLKKLTYRIYKVESIARVKMIMAK